MREIWKDVVGYENLYKVSNFGLVKRIKTGKKVGSGNYERNELVLKQRKNNKGYAIVDLYKSNKRGQFLVHRLVTLSFIPKPDSCDFVNHIDEDKNNNHLANLEWCTRKYNMNHGTAKYRIGIKNSIKINMLSKDGGFIRSFDSAKQAERELKINNSNINECLRTKRKSAGGFIWQYAK